MMAPSTASIPSEIRSRKRRRRMSENAEEGSTRPSIPIPGVGVGVVVGRDAQRSGASSDSNSDNRDRKLKSASLDEEQETSGNGRVESNSSSESESQSESSTSEYESEQEEHQRSSSIHGSDNDEIDEVSLNEIDETNETAKKTQSEEMRSKSAQNVEKPNIVFTPHVEKNSPHRKYAPQFTAEEFNFFLNLLLAANSTRVRYEFQTRRVRGATVHKGDSRVCADKKLGSYISDRFEDKFGYCVKTARFADIERALVADYKSFRLCFDNEFNDLRRDSRMWMLLVKEFPSVMQWQSRDFPYFQRLHAIVRQAEGEKYRWTEERLAYLAKLLAKIRPIAMKSPSRVKSKSNVYAIEPKYYEMIAEGMNEEFSQRCGVPDVKKMEAHLRRRLQIHEDCFKNGKDLRKDPKQLANLLERHKKNDVLRNLSHMLSDLQTAFPDSSSQRGKFIRWDHALESKLLGTVRACRRRSDGSLDLEAVRQLFSARVGTVVSYNAVETRLRRLREKITAFDLIFRPDGTDCRTDAEMWASLTQLYPNLKAWKDTDFDQVGELKEIYADGAQCVSAVRRVEASMQWDAYFRACFTMDDIETYRDLWTENKRHYVNLSIMLPDGDTFWKWNATIDRELFELLISARISNESYGSQKVCLQDIASNLTRKFGVLYEAQDVRSRSTFLRHQYNTFHRVVQHSKSRDVSDIRDDAVAWNEVVQSDAELIRWEKYDFVHYEFLHRKLREMWSEGDSDDTLDNLLYSEDENYRVRRMKSYLARKNCFIDMLYDITLQHVDINKKPPVYQNEFLADINKRFMEATGVRYSVSKAKRKVKHLQTEYESYRLVFDAQGKDLRKDCTLWKSLLRKHPEAKKWEKRDLDHFDKLKKIFPDGFEDVCQNNVRKNRMTDQSLRKLLEFVYQAVGAQKFHITTFDDSTKPIWEQISNQMAWTFHTRYEPRFLHRCMRELRLAYNSYEVLFITGSDARRDSVKWSELLEVSPTSRRWKNEDFKYYREMKRVLRAGRDWFVPRERTFVERRNTQRDLQRHILRLARASIPPHSRDPCWVFVKVSLRWMFQLEHSVLELKRVVNLQKRRYLSFQKVFGGGKDLREDPVQWEDLLAKSPQVIEWTVEDFPFCSEIEALLAAQQNPSLCGSSHENTKRIKQPTRFWPRDHIRMLLNIMATAVAKGHASPSGRFHSRKYRDEVTDELCTLTHTVYTGVMVGRKLKQLSRQWKSFMLVWNGHEDLRWSNRKWKLLVRKYPCVKMWKRKNFPFHSDMKRMAEGRSVQYVPLKSTDRKNTWSRVGSNMISEEREARAKLGMHASSSPKGHSFKVCHHIHAVVWTVPKLKVLIEVYNRTVRESNVFDDLWLELYEEMNEVVTFTDILHALIFRQETLDNDKQIESILNHESWADMEQDIRRQYSRMPNISPLVQHVEGYKCSFESCTFRTNKAGEIISHLIETHGSVWKTDRNSELQNGRDNSLRGYELYENRQEYFKTIEM